MVDLLHPLGQAALHHIRPELHAVGGVAHPLALNGEVLPGDTPGMEPTTVISSSPTSRRRMV